MGIIKTQEARNALKLGFLCSIAYLACYFARNLLGVLTPSMEKLGVWTTQEIGYISTAYFICYACGQLINGALGDRVRAVYLVSTGLILAGACNFIFAFANNFYLAIAVYGLSGYGLSMVYAPMVKTVSENTTPEFATRCLLGFTFASFLGSPMAGLAGMLFSWQVAFIVCFGIAAIMGISIFMSFRIFEKQRVIIHYGRHENAQKQTKISALFKKGIVKWTIVSALTGIVRTAVLFWATTFFSDYLGYGAEKAAMIYSVITLINSFSPYFNNLVVYERILKRNRDLSVFVMFVLSTIFFALLFFVKLRLLAVIIFLLALMTNSGASTILWSIYCPSLKDTGRTSSATGFLDFISYIAAAIASSVFANAVSSVGWQPLIIIWASLMLTGVIACLPFKRFSARKQIASESEAEISERPAEEAIEETEEKTVEENFQNICGQDASEHSDDERKEPVTNKTE